HGVIDCDQRQPVLGRLGNQNAIEWVTVQGRKPSEMGKSGFLDWQRLNLMCIALARQIVGGGLWQVQFAQRVLDDCLPYRGHAQVHFICRVTYGVVELAGQLRSGGNVPEEDLGIQ
ncbi:MAG: hypothetical protein WEH44_00105, partial [Pirellulaceae bacterium]